MSDPYVPAWMRPDFLTTKSSVPDWLRGAPKRDPTTATPRGNTEQTIAVLTAKFELAFPRLIDRLYAGETLNNILADFPIPIEQGAFMRWIKKDPLKFSVYTEAKETRTEIWTGRLLDIAEKAEINGQGVELDHVKVIIDTYKFLIKAENRKGYGDSKQIELTQNISVTAAMQAGENRIAKIAAFQDDDEEQPTFKQIAEASAIEAEWEEVDDEN